MRFLVARSFDTDKATKMFVQWKDWRASFVPLNYIPESQVTDELQHKKIYLQSLSTNGHPVIIVKVHMHTHNKDQLQFKSTCVCVCVFIVISFEGLLLISWFNLFVSCFFDMIVFYEEMPFLAFYACQYKFVSWLCPN